MRKVVNGEINLLLMLRFLSYYAVYLSVSEIRRDVIASPTK